MKNRIEPNLTEQYQKDNKFEIFIDKFNAILKDFHEDEYKNLEEIYPTLHIIGVPRSGTTLLTQLISFHTNIGYINNLIAAFWQAPLYGIQLSKKLLKNEKNTAYQSEFGRTQRVNEPHEFGYFWSSLLDYKEMKEKNSSSAKLINWDRVQLVLKNMTHTFGSPIVFKSFLLGWHIETMQQVLPKTCWVHIKRDPEQNALSILNARKKMLGSFEEWIGPKPKEYEWLRNESYCKQVTGQFFYLDKKYNDQLSNIPSKSKLELTYDELCDSPQTILEKIISLLKNNGADIDLLSLPPSKFSKHRYNVTLHPDGKDIQSAMQYFLKKINNK